jgi:RNA polymerase sigma factor (sigma-70 family)
MDDQRYNLTEAPSDHPETSPVKPLGSLRPTLPARSNRHVTAAAGLPPEEEIPEAVHKALQDALRTIRAWPTPPNWSHSDWSAERVQAATWACFQAFHEYNPNRSSITLEVFIRYRVMARVLTAYRREWSFSRRCKPLSAADDTGEGQHGENPESSAQSQLAVAIEPEHASELCEIREVLHFVSEPIRWVVVQIFWCGFTESELAEQLGLSQRAVSKRKQTALKYLRRWLLN